MLNDWGCWQLNRVFFPSFVRLFFWGGGIGSHLTLEALGFFPVFLSQIRWQSSPEFGIFNLEHLGSKLNFDPVTLTSRGNWKGRGVGSEGSPLLVEPEKWGRLPLWPVGSHQFSFSPLKSRSGFAHLVPQTSTD